MKTAIAELEGIAPYSASKHVTVPMREGEKHDDYDKRVWREKIYTDDNGHCYVPGQVLKKAIDSTAGQLGWKVQGRGAKTWTSLFKAGVLCVEPIHLYQPASQKIVTSSNAPQPGKRVHVMQKEVDFVDVHCDANPQRRGSGRVWRRFPIVHQWFGTATFLIVNDDIGEKIFRQHLEMCGRINGVGRYRAQLGGEYGRFKIVDFAWHDEARVKAA